jgi:hypothetical protein
VGRDIRQEELALGLFTADQRYMHVAVLELHPTAPICDFA